MHSALLRSGLAVTAAALLAACGVADPAPVPAGSSAVPVAPPSEAALADVTYLTDCDDSLLSRPHSYVLACADANERLEGLTWNGWGEPTAAATGMLITNDCTPDCARGKDIRYAVRVVASKLTRGEGAATYRSLTVTPTGDHPSWAPANETYDLPGVEDDAAATMSDG